MSMIDSLELCSKYINGVDNVLCGVISVRKIRMSIGYRFSLIHMYMLHSQVYCVTCLSVVCVTHYTLQNAHAYWYTHMYYLHKRLVISYY